METLLIVLVVLFLLAGGVGDTLVARLARSQDESVAPPILFVAFMKVRRIEQIPEPYSGSPNQVSPPESGSLVGISGKPRV
jgi:hypothetical protein